MARKSLEIAKTLERDILAGKFAPGELMDEMALARRFEASRTPVREALLNLSATGLVELQRGRGAVVVGVSLERIFDTYEVLAELMGFAACLSAKRLTPLQRANLEALHEDIGRVAGNDSREDYQRLDARFHDALVHGCGNSVLIHQITECERTISAVRRASIESYESLDGMYNEHQGIVDAIRRGDAEAARNAMREHLQLRSGGATRLMASWRAQDKTSTPSG